MTSGPVPEGTAWVLATGRAQKNRQRGNPRAGGGIRAPAGEWGRGLRRTGCCKEYGMQDKAPRCIVPIDCWHHHYSFRLSFSTNGTEIDGTRAFVREIDISADGSRIVVGTT